MKNDKTPTKHEVNNRANQVNPNNQAYEKSRLNGSNDDEELEETYGDDWEFNHD